MGPEEFPQYEKSNNNHSVLRDEVLAIETRIDELYKKKSANPEGTYFTESMEIPSEWLEFVEKVDDVLCLSKEESKESARIIEKLFQGKLNDEESKDDLEALLLLRMRFDDEKKGGGDIH